MKSTPKIGNLLYDVGMNIGQDTDFYLKSGYHVAAFEAGPNNAEFCRKKYAEETRSGQLIIVEGAISEKSSSDDEPHKTRFYQNEDHTHCGTTSDDFAYRNKVMGTAFRIIEVDTIDFKKCLEEYGIPHYLKADIVGDEISCFRASPEFENRPGYLSIRSDKVVFRKLERESELLDMLGYERFKAIQQDVTDWKVSFKSDDGEKIDYIFQDGASGPFGEITDGKWETLKEVLRDYRRIFTYYWLFGDYSYLQQTEKGRKFVEQLERIARRPLPGWSDTHAEHSSVVD